MVQQLEEYALRQRGATSLGKTFLIGQEYTRSTPFLLLRRYSNGEAHFCPTSSFVNIAFHPQEGVHGTDERNARKLDLVCPLNTPPRNRSAQRRTHLQRCQLCRRYQRSCLSK